MFSSSLYVVIQTVFQVTTKDGIIICSYEASLDPWMSSLWRMLNMIKPQFLPNGPDVVIQDAVLIDQPKVQITYHNSENLESRFSSTSGIPNWLSSWLTCNFSIFVTSKSLCMYVAFVVYDSQSL